MKPRRRTARATPKRSTPRAETSLSTSELDSPVGPLLAAVDDDGALVFLQFTTGASRDELEGDLERRGFSVTRNKARCREVARQVREYFRGKRTEFDLELRPPGTKFQQRVWRELAKVPYGETVSYAQLARRARNPKAVRAVGRCNALNPIVVVLPCHRVIGSNGKLTGYGGGIPVKQKLLELEGALVG